MVYKLMLTATAVLSLGITAAHAAHHAAPKSGHTWFNVNYADGVCEKSAATPERTQGTMDSSMARLQGVSMDRISPDDVEKGTDGNIHVTLHGTQNGSPVTMEFFTSMAACKDFLNTEGVTRQQAPGEDIN